MKRTQLQRDYINGPDKEYVGWYDSDASTKLAGYSKGTSSKKGYDLIRTASGQLIVRVWTNSGAELHRVPYGDQEVCEILVLSEYEGTDPELLRVLRKWKK